MLLSTRLGHGLFLVLSAALFAACDTPVDLRPSTTTDQPNELESPVGEQTQSKQDKPNSSPKPRPQDSTDSDEAEDEIEDEKPRYAYVGQKIEIDAKTKEAFKERKILGAEYQSILRAPSKDLELKDIQQNANSIYIVYSNAKSSRLERWDRKDDELVAHSEIDLSFSADKMQRVGSYLYVFGSQEGVAVMYQVQSHSKKGMSIAQQTKLGAGEVSDVRRDGKSFIISLKDENVVQRIDISNPTSIASPEKIWDVKRPQVSFKYKKKLLVFGASHIWYGAENEEPEVFQLYENELEVSSHQVSLQKNHLMLMVGDSLHSFDLRKIESGKIYFDNEESFETPPAAFSFYKDLAFADQEDSFEILSFENVFHPFSIGFMDFEDKHGASSKIWIQKVSKEAVYMITRNTDQSARILKLWLEVKPSSVSLVASKYYSPSVWNDAEVKAKGYEFEIPAMIPVVAGNAGNHQASIRFDDVVCNYKGGSAQSHPNNESQWNKGLKYEFLSCSNGMKSGDRIKTEKAVSMSVANGDSYFSPTEIAIELKVY